MKQQQQQQSYRASLCALHLHHTNSFSPLSLFCSRFIFAKLSLKRSVVVIPMMTMPFFFFRSFGKNKGLIHAWLWRYSLRCQPIDWSDSPDEQMVVFLCWCYFFCKLTELLDTVFFVLRKKFDQITHLHVIHHTIMPASVWWGVRFVPSGE